MSRLVSPRPSTQVPPIRFNAEAEREDVAGDRSGAAIVLMKSSGSGSANNHLTDLDSHDTAFCRASVCAAIQTYVHKPDGPGTAFAPWLPRRILRQLNMKRAYDTRLGTPTGIRSDSPRDERKVGFNSRRPASNNFLYAPMGRGRGISMMIGRSLLGPFVVNRFVPRQLK